MTAVAIAASVVAPTDRAAAHHERSEPEGWAFVEAYPRLQAAAEANPRVHAGRDVLHHGRASDGRVVWAAVIADGRRMYRALRPGPEREHERRTRAAWLASGTPAANRALGRAMAAERGWTGAEWWALDRLWTRESRWRRVWNTAGSGACHIPQALPCSKIPGGIGASARTAIRWGLGYIAGRYGRPTAALAHSDSRGWY